MADKIDFQLHGIDELKAALAELSPKIRKQALRGALREAAKVFQASARASAPILKAPTKTRSPGTIRKNITIRGSKFARKAGDEGVYVSVRPLRGKQQIKLGKAGARNPNDPFYWWFMEFGTRKMAAAPFMRPAAQKGSEAISVFMRSVIPAIEKLNKKAGNGR